MSKVLRVGVDLPERILDLFAVVGDDLCWIDERPEGRGWQRKRVPWGEKAGGAIVLGRGRVICLSGMNLLTCDVRYALENAGGSCRSVGAP